MEDSNRDGSPEKSASSTALPGGRGALRIVALLWLSACIVALLGTLIVYDSLPGVNWGIWITLAALGLLGLLRVAGRPLRTDVIVPALMAVALAWSAAFTSSDFFHFAIAVAVATLLALSVLVAAGLPMRMVGAVRLFLAPPVAAAFAMIEVIRRKVEAVGLISGGHPVRVVRGMLLAIPVVAVFALLLSGADPMFEAARSATFRALESLSFLDRLIIFGVFGTVSLGGYGLALRGDGALQQQRLPSPREFLGDTERVIVLGSVAALFATFILLQLGYLFGDPGAMRGSGVTYAGYARRGFGELTAAATLCAGLLIGLERWKLPGRHEGAVKVLSLAVIAELHLLLESALRRIHLYEAAYGHTTDRLYGQVFMAAVSATLLLLAWELWVGLDARRLARRAASVAFACLLVLTVWNHESWVARRNLDRASATGKVDIAYLGRSLSLDAAPAVTAGMHRLTAEQQHELRVALHAQHYDPDAGAARRWWEWNARRMAGVRALLAAGIEIDQPPPSPPPVESSGR